MREAVAQRLTSLLAEFGFLVEVESSTEQATSSKKQARGDVVAKGTRWDKEEWR